MSRIGKKPVVIPSGVKVEKKELELTVTGPKGVLKLPLHPKVIISVNDKEVTVDVAKKEGAKLAPAGAQLIALMGDGSFRDTHGTLEKVIAATGKATVTREDVEEVTGAPKSELVRDFAGALARKDAGIRDARTSPCCFSPTNSYHASRIASVTCIVRITVSGNGIWMRPRRLSSSLKSLLGSFSAIFMS